MTPAEGERSLRGAARREQCVQQEREPHERQRLERAAAGAAVRLLAALERRLGRRFFHDAGAIAFEWTASAGEAGVRVRVGSTLYLELDGEIVQTDGGGERLVPVRDPDAP